MPASTAKNPTMPLHEQTRNQEDFCHDHQATPRPASAPSSANTKTVSFKSLPRELRQGILMYTCEGDNNPDACGCRDRTFRKHWLATLRQVNTQFLDDITYVENDWRRRLGPNCEFCGERLLPAQATTLTCLYYGLMAREGA